MELAIDTASEQASIALTEQGQLVSEHTWRCYRNHSRELLVAIDALLAGAGCAKTSLTLVTACTGPGGYTGVRVGLSVAQGLALALGLPTVGIGRLEAEAYPHRLAGGPVCALHMAGRGELAWALYRQEADRWCEVLPPRLSSPEQVLQGTEPTTLYVGEVPAELAAAVRARGGRVAEGALNVRRAGFLAELGWLRLCAGQAVAPDRLNALYLREPTIGAQRSGR